MPTYGEVLRVPGYLPVFLANALSMWGDYIARVTIAAVVFERTRSPLATATALVVSLVPTFFGRSLVGPVVDRFPYKHVLIWAHSARAVCVLVLVVLVGTNSSLWLVLGALFVLEMIGGAATASNMVLTTDLFEDRHLYARAVGLSAMSEQFNQAVGLAVGGGLVALLGPRTGLLIDFTTFVVAAVVVFVVVELRPVDGARGKGVRGFLRDLGTAAGDLARHSVLARLMALSAVATLAIAAPEALAIPIAGQHGWGGVLMASPIIGAVVGIVLIGRRDVHDQNASMLQLAIAMPLPLLLLALDPPVWVVAVLFFASGMLQSFMVPLQSTFALVTEPALRGRIFSLAGAVAVGAAGASFLVAGSLAQATNPPVGVALSAAVCLALLIGVALTWPHGHVRSAVDEAYATPATRSHAA
ncbi:MFS transporter [Intrasporangium oryzae NRRL B-24470]|uniref:MFS transporter n=1 Tax=Intrasporangium oryzae NRRL B-24470 TaxID=1386089 RepID=W9G692_9MICO|nr:MFS transporter [Intrasporangium oryzae NRRL B-24470]